MRSLNGYPKELDVLLGARYTIPYYQREYKWGKKQIEELIDDLTEEFAAYYKSEHSLIDVKSYGMYFLGPIIVTKDQNIIDGQQRLTSLTLLLIYINHLQKEWKCKQIALDSLIFTESFGEKAFVINDEERNACMTGLYEKNAYEMTGQESESVMTLIDRYGDITGQFEEILTVDSLPLFIEWLKKKVVFIEIEADSIDDAHVIFESMNDRGLRLSAVEMLKGYILARISDENLRNKANETWKRTMKHLIERTENGDITFINNWLRAKYADSIRERKAGSTNKDYEVIANMANKWVSQNTKKLRLLKSADYEQLVSVEIPFYAGVFNSIVKHSNDFSPDFEYVYYNAHRDFTLQTQLILAAIKLSDTKEIIEKKIKMVSWFIDQYISMRTFSFKSVSYSSTLYSVFNITKDIRDKDIDQLYQYIRQSAKDIHVQFPFDRIDEFRLNQFTARYMMHILARLISYISTQSGIDLKFPHIVNRKIKDSYDIEHIWANVFEQDNHQKEFTTAYEFEQYRNMFGGLLLLPKSINRSLKDLPYNDKRFKYVQQNILAKSLHPDCYKNEPGFKRFINDSGLSFKPFDKFDRSDLDERQRLYKEIAKKIWSLESLDDCLK